ncbi:MAG: hypothetical protein VXW65_04555 [Pseudomonadota bacterium]|nr:hypothetical protein [Pseudomonadota bacterium]
MTSKPAAPFSLADLTKATPTQAATLEQPKPQRTHQKPQRPPFGTRRSMGKR